ncbi:MAG: xanthine dehydrogenase molybdopterin binding subunit [Candidatus Xenobia bacterium]
MTDALEFTLNGKPVVATGVPANMTLLNWLRQNGWCGTKEGCAEGDCGACTVAISDVDVQGRPVWRAITSCITFLTQVAGREVVTVEGLHGHPAQQAMVRHYGSQCGYCTPGFIMSMFEMASRGSLSQDAISDQLCGNLCRCTGYRPIRDAAAEVPGDATAPPAAPCLGAVSQPGFARPTSMQELLALLPQGRLVAGATELGVDHNKKGHRFPLLIASDGVPELRRIETTERGWRIGGAATLTDVEEAVPIPALQKMLRVFASRQIRNRATLAGNLATASPIGDMAPVLLALDASLELRSLSGTRQVPLDAFFVGYRRTLLQPGEMIAAIDVPAPRGRVDSYKVSKRRELDISIVAAAFCIETDDAGRIRHARLAYGGVAATPVRARQTEAFLLGRTVDTEALAMLAQEFTPMDDVRAGAAYRRGLVVSLLEKFWHRESSLAQEGALTWEPGPTWPAGRAEQVLPHESATGHVSGRAQYVDDTVRSKPFLDVWPVMAPHAHARIARRDATVARSMPGVVAVLMAEDVPGVNDVGALRRDEMLLADREVMFHGHMVALVIGDSLDACRAAAEKVEVDYEPLPAILTIQDAVAQSSFHTEPHRIRRGDCETALATSPHLLEGELATGGQEHFYLEAQAAWAERGDDDDIFVCSSTQHPSEIQACVAHVLNLPRHRVVVQAPRMGGGFGGKETQGNTWAAVVALAAWKTQRPVRLQLDRDVDMQLTGKRHPFWSRYRVGFDDDGRVRGLWVEVFSDGGWSVDLSESINDRALFHLDNVYYLPAVDMTGRVTRTHMVSHTAFRGFGGPQGIAVIEEIMDRMARTLGLAPELVRERNLYHGSGETNTTPYGMEIADNRVQTLWQSVLEKADFAARRRAVTEWNAEHPHVKRGLAVTAVKFGISFTNPMLNQAGALVNVYRDGSVQVNHGGTEMGQGLYTKIRGVAMRELGLPADRIRVMKTSTDKVPNTAPTAASSGSDMNGQAVKAACDTLKERLLPLAGELLGVPPDAWREGRVWAGEKSVSFAELVDKAWQQRISLSATGYYRTPNLDYVKARGQGRPFYYFAGGAAVSEVEVDGFTGMKRVLRVDVVHDVGDSLNYGVDRGQIEGAFVQGMGWLTGEELLWDEKGRLLTHSASTYQIPSFSDAPMVFNVTLLPNAAQDGTIHGSKAVGEPPLMLAFSVREALRDAIAAFGNGGIVELAAPATHEAIYRAVQQQRAASPSLALS